MSTIPWNEALSVVNYKPDVLKIVFDLSTYTFVDMTDEQFNKLTPEQKSEYRRPNLNYLHLAHYTFSPNDGAPRPDEMKMDTQFLWLSEYYGKISEIRAQALFEIQDCAIVSDEIVVSTQGKYWGESYYIFDDPENPDTSNPVDGNLGTKPYEWSRFISRTPHPIYEKCFFRDKGDVTRNDEERNVYPNLNQDANADYRYRPWVLVDFNSIFDADATGNHSTWKYMTGADTNALVFSEYNCINQEAFAEIKNMTGAGRCTARFYGSDQDAEIQTEGQLKTFNYDVRIAGMAAAGGEYLFKTEFSTKEDEEAGDSQDEPPKNGMSFGYCDGMHKNVKELGSTSGDENNPSVERTAYIREVRCPPSDLRIEAYDVRNENYVCIKPNFNGTYKQFFLCPDNKIRLSSVTVQVGETEEGVAHRCKFDYGNAKAAGFDVKTDAFPFDLRQSGCQLADQAKQMSFKSYFYEVLNKDLDYTESLGIPDLFRPTGFYSGMTYNQTGDFDVNEVINQCQAFKGKTDSEISSAIGADTLLVKSFEKDATYQELATALKDLRVDTGRRQLECVGYIGIVGPANVLSNAYDLEYAVGTINGMNSRYVEHRFRDEEGLLVGSEIEMEASEFANGLQGDDNIDPKLAEMSENLKGAKFLFFPCSTCGFAAMNKVNANYGEKIQCWNTFYPVFVYKKDALIVHLDGYADDAPERPAITHLQETVAKSLYSNQLHDYWKRNPEAKEIDELENPDYYENTDLMVNLLESYGYEDEETVCRTYEELSAAISLSAERFESTVIDVACPVARDEGGETRFVLKRTKDGEGLTKLNMNYKGFRRLMTNLTFICQSDYATGAFVGHSNNQMLSTVQSSINVKDKKYGMSVFLSDVSRSHSSYDEIWNGDGGAEHYRQAETRLWSKIYPFAAMFEYAARHFTEQDVAFSYRQMAGYFYTTALNLHQTATDIVSKSLVNLVTAMMYTPKFIITGAHQFKYQPKAVKFMAENAKKTVQDAIQTVNDLFTRFGIYNVMDESSAPGRIWTYFCACSSPAAIAYYVFQKANGNEKYKDVNFLENFRDDPFFIDETKNVEGTYYEKTKWFVEKYVKQMIKAFKAFNEESSAATGYSAGEAILAVIWYINYNSYIEKHQEDETSDHHIDESSFNKIKNAIEDVDSLYSYLYKYLIKSIVRYDEVTRTSLDALFQLIEEHTPECEIMTFDEYGSSLINEEGSFEDPSIYYDINDKYENYIKNKVYEYNNQVCIRFAKSTLSSEFNKIGSYLPNVYQVDENGNYTGAVKKFLEYDAETGKLVKSEKYAEICDAFYDDYLPAIDRVATTTIDCLYETWTTLQEDERFRKIFIENVEFENDDENDDENNNENDDENNNENNNKNEDEKDMFIWNVIFTALLQDFQYAATIGDNDFNSKPFLT